MERIHRGLLLAADRYSSARVARLLDGTLEAAGPATEFSVATARTRVRRSITLGVGARSLHVALEELDWDSAAAVVALGVVSCGIALWVGRLEAPLLDLVAGSLDRREGRSARGLLIAEGESERVVAGRLVERFPGWRIPDRVPSTRDELLDEMLAGTFAEGSAVR